MTRRQFGVFAASAAGQLAGASKESLVYIGTYTKGDSKGIYVQKFDPVFHRQTNRRGGCGGVGKSLRFYLSRGITCMRSGKRTAAWSPLLKSTAQRAS